MKKPQTTLFLIQSLDGKISTGDNNTLDVDKDFRRIAEVKEGLSQYYDLEKTTDRVSFNSGLVMAKVGVNEKEWIKGTHDDIDFVVVDNKPHLTMKGCEYFAKRSAKFFVVTTNKEHPAFDLSSKYPSIVIFHYENRIDFTDVFRKLNEDHGVERMTIQTGGTLNAELLRLSLIDAVSIVVAPCLIGGKDTQSVIGGESLHNEEDLKKIRALKLIKADVLKNSYLHLQYRVINDAKMEII